MKIRSSLKSANGRYGQGHTEELSFGRVESGVLQHGGDGGYGANAGQGEVLAGQLQ